jgi:cytochrome P450
MTFKECVSTVSVNILVKVVVPSWAMGFTKSLRKARLAFEEMEVCTQAIVSSLILTNKRRILTILQKYFTEMIQDRKTISDGVERYDLFSCLLQANEQEDTASSAKLTNRELFGPSLLHSW